MLLICYTAFGVFIPILVVKLFDFIKNICLHLAKR